MYGFINIKFNSAVFLLLISASLITSCGHAPTTLSNANQYVRLGVLPVYEPKIDKFTPPTWGASARYEKLDWDIGLNKEVVDRFKKTIGPDYEIVDLQSFSAAYIGIEKIYSSGDRKIIGDSRPLYTDVVRSGVGDKGLDGYLVIKGGPGLGQLSAAPAFEPFVRKRYVVSMPLTIYVIDGRTFTTAAVNSTYFEPRTSSQSLLGQPNPQSTYTKEIPASWFVEPNQHAVEINAVVFELLDKNLAPVLQKLGFSTRAVPKSAH